MSDYTNGLPSIKKIAQHGIDDVAVVRQIGFVITGYMNTSKRHRFELTTDRAVISVDDRWYSKTAAFCEYHDYDTLFQGIKPTELIGCRVSMSIDEVGLLIREKADFIPIRINSPDGRSIAAMRRQR